MVSILEIQFSEVLEHLQRESRLVYFEVTKAESIEAIGQEGKVSIEMK